MSFDTILVQITAYDPVASAPVTIRASSSWAIGDAAVVLNGQKWTPALSQAPSYTIDLGTVQGSTSADDTDTLPQLSMTYSAFELYIAPELGNLAWQAYDFDGATFDLWTGTYGGTFANYTHRLNCLCGAHQMTDPITASIQLRGTDTLLLGNMLTASYGGTGGADGDTGLKGTLKPWVSGSALNVSPFIIDSANQVYQVHGYGAIGDINAVYENALSLGNPVTNTCASYSDLMALSLAPGTWAKAPAVGMFRLGAIPTGTITADATGALDGAATPATVGAICSHVMRAQGGIPAASISSTSVANLDQSFNHSWNTYVTDQITVGDFVRDALSQVHGYILPNSAGQWIFGRDIDGGATTTLNGDQSTLPVVLPGAQQIANPSSRVWDVRVGQSRNWTVLDASQVSDAVKQAIVQAAGAATTAAAAQTTATGAQTTATQANNTSNANSTAITNLQNNPALDTTAPAVPTGLTAGSGLNPQNNLANLTLGWTAVTSSNLDHYDVQVATNGGNYVSVGSPTTNSFVVYGLQPNTPIQAQVRSVSKAGVLSSFSTVISYTVTKDSVAPSAPTALTVYSVGLGGLTLKWTNDTAVDLASVAIYENTTNNSATAVQIATVNALPGQAGGYSRSGLPSGSLRYYWLKSLDTSNNPSAFSAVASGTVSSVAAADFTPGLQPTATVASLPSASGYTGPSVLFNQADGKIYRYTGGAFVANVATSDLAGTLTAAQIGSGIIDATKLANGTVAPQVVTKTNMNDGSVTAPFGGAIAYNIQDGKLYRNTNGSNLTTAWAPLVVGTGDLSGLISANQLTANSITSGLLVSGAITTRELGAGSVTATAIVGGTITADKLVAGSLTAANIQAGSLTGDRFTAGTITAAQLAVGAVTVSNIAVQGASLFPDGQMQDQAWWTRPGIGQTGAQNPAGSFYIDNNPTPGVVAAKGSLNAWVSTGTVTGSTQNNIQLIAPVVMGITPGAWYEFKSQVYNSTNRPTTAFIINWIDGSGNFMGTGDQGVGCPNDATSRALSMLVQAPSGAAGYRLYWDTNGSTSAFTGQIYIGGITVRQANTGTMIVDGSLNATKITAGTITGDRLAVGTITGDKISSSTSLPASLTIGSTGFSLQTVAGAANTPLGQNLVPYSDFQATTNYWSVYYNTAGIPTQLSNGVYLGRKYMNVGFTPTAAGQTIDLCANPSLATDLNNSFPVVGGATYAISAFFAGSNTSSQIFRCWWYDTNGVNSGNALTQSDVNISGTGNNQQVGIFAVAPAGAVRARVEWYATSSGTSQATLTCCQPMVCQVAPGTTIQPAYNPGPIPDAGRVINANTTTINPGKVLISGGTTLSNWIWGGDNTSINGGALGTNTVTANKMTIGHRNLNFPGVSFQVINGGNSMVCSNGYAQWIDGNGNMQQVSLQGGTVTPGQGFWYIYWTEGSGGYGFTTDSSFATRSDVVCLCTWYSPSYLMVQNYGGTIIDGSMITTGSINASQTITAGSIVTGNLQDNSVTQWILASNPGPFQGGTQSGSGSGGGGGGVTYCVADTSFMPLGKRAGDMAIGDDLHVLNREDDMGYHIEHVVDLARSVQSCSRIETVSGITLVVSNSTPITLRGGKVVPLMAAHGKEVPVSDADGFRWEKIKLIEPLGELPVTLIFVNHGTYAAGEQQGRYIFTHNKVAQP